ncbi:hypothetical protein E24_00269 [Faustovirus]|nr:hypothetical protein PRJ_Fausto_00254 [Faustovirus]AMN83193.1 hypothetical protein E24_00269 [Faustovirus]AMN84174.1 hypothetical protein D5a_00268 [Faustovirus]AMN85163.1 hypothetical protein E23_00268 [Faustovirus]QBR99162.1 hypothetical protein [Faustovirus mariensis]
MEKLTVVAERRVPFIPPKDIPSVEAVFNEVCKDYPDLTLLLASGALEDVCKISDVNISLLYDPARASSLFKNIIRVTEKPTHTIYTLDGYAREVNVYTTTDNTAYSRAATYRENELYINAKYPDIYKEARENKSFGLNTEQSYAHAIGAHKLDPYAVLLHRDVIDECIEQMHKRQIQNILL